jgi:micrococcal nuclease
MRIHKINNLGDAGRGDRHHLRFKRCLSPLFLLLILLLTGCRENGTANNNTYLVHHIIDGDTIELVNGKKVRYTGIDTPETRKRVGRDWVEDPEEYAISAKNFNEELVAANNVRLEFDESAKDKYGRWLAYVYTDNGMMANEELLREGLATVYTFPPNTKYYKRFLEAQEEAKNNKRGMWKTLKTIFPSKALDNIGKLRKVIAAVDHIEISANAIYIQLGPDKEKDLTLLIYVNNFPLFAKEGISPSNLKKGQSIQVVGKIELRNNAPIMIIDNPSQIEA